MVRSVAPLLHMPSARRFPRPCTIEEHNNACFIVKDATGQALGCFYFDEERLGARRPSCSARTRPAAY